MVCYTRKHKVSFMVDGDDFDFVLSHTWHCNSDGYVATRIGERVVPLHRLLIKTPTGMITDHINGDKLDNRKCNLRVCNRNQNAHNQGQRTGYSSRYKGVYWHKRDKRWAAGIRNNGQPIHLGYFAKEKDAAIAYNNKAKEMFGEFARLNIIDP